MSHPIANAFVDAAQQLGQDGIRQGNLLSFSADDEIVYCGDIHGHRANLAKIIGFANLGMFPNRRLVLQEIIHEHLDSAALDKSIEVLLRAVRLKLSYPGQVYFLMGNHDIAQLTGNEITKDGAGVCLAFDAAIDSMFGPDAGEVRLAVHQFLRAQPLAAACPNGMFLSHSLPGPARMGLVDWTILQRPYAEEDLRRRGAVYEFTWGRDHTAGQLAQLKEKLHAAQFLLGHQPMAEGYAIVHRCEVILSSDHGHGCIMVFPAGGEVPDEGLRDLIQPIAGL